MIARSSSLKEEGLWPGSKKIRDLEREPPKRRSDQERRNYSLTIYKSLRDNCGRLYAPPFLELYLGPRGIKAVPFNALITLPEAFLADAPDYKDGKPFASSEYIGMVLPVRDLTGRFQGMQVTWLEPGKGDHPGFVKANLEVPRNSYGMIRGNFVPLSDLKSASDTLLIGEGVETVLSAMQVTKLPGIATAGAWNTDLKLMRCRSYIVLADNGEAGEKFARAVALHLRADDPDCTVRVARPVQPKGGKKGYDWNDALLDGINPPDMKQQIMGAPVFTDKPRAVIKVQNANLAEQIDQAEQALVDAGISLFVRGAGVLVRPVSRDREAAKGRTTRVTLFIEADEHSLAYQLSKHAAVFKRMDGRSNKWVPIEPPERVTRGLLAKKEWLFPDVVGVIGAPTLRPDGTILHNYGYDPATRLWCYSDVNLPPIPDKPGYKDAEAALELLEELLQEFPFTADTDRAVALAAIMTAVLRGAFDLSPGFAIVAHAAGSGKSYLVDLVSCLVTSRVCPVITSTRTVDEMEKRLGAVLMEGGSMISLDNASHNLEGDLLAQMLSQKTVKPRVLGKSHMPECEWRGTLFATGNNIRPVRDLIRRFLTCRLDPKVERPDLRSFKFDPIKKVLGNRARYLAAALTIARAYVAAGRPTKMVPLAGYVDWMRNVCEPLVWLGVGNPIDSMEEARSRDPERMEALALLEQLKVYVKFNKPFTASEVVTKATDENDNGRRMYPEFFAALLELAPSKQKAGAIDVRVLGEKLKRIEGDIIAGMRIEVTRHNGKAANKYQLVKLGKG